MKNFWELSKSIKICCWIISQIGMNKNQKLYTGFILVYLNITWQTD